MTSFTTLFIIFTYFAILGILGLRGYKKTKTFKDYVIGGRKLGPVVAAMNVAASDMSSWLLMGLPGAFYLFGFNQVWIIIGLVIGSFASWKLIAPRLRIYSELANDSITISSFLENRFEDKTKILRLITAIAILMFFTVYISSGFVASAKLFSTMFPVSYKNALIFSVLFIVFYAFLGGFLAVSWADLFQGTLMLFVLIAVPFGIAHDMGGLEAVFSKISTISPSHLNPFHGMTLLSILSLLSWGLGYFGQPHIISKYMAIKDATYIKTAYKICISWMVLSMLAAAFIGLFGFAYFYETPLKNHESVLIHSASILFPTFFLGLVIAAMLAAIMSTINGQILISCATLSEDFYKRFFRKNAEQKELLIISRIFVLLITFCTFFIAGDENATVLGLVSYAWSGLGASIGPVMICALFVKRTTKLAAICGVITGGLSSVLFSFVKIFPYELLPAFLLSIFVILVISFLQKQPIKQEVEQIFNRFYDK